MHDDDDDARDFKTMSDTNLDHVTTKELVDEVMRRHDHAAFIGIIERRGSPGDVTSAEHGLYSDFTGNQFMVMGLMAFAQDRVATALEVWRPKI